MAGKLLDVKKVLWKGAQSHSRRGNSKTVPWVFYLQELFFFFVVGALIKRLRRAWDTACVALLAHIHLWGWKWICSAILRAGYAVISPCQRHGTAMVSRV